MNKSLIVVCLAILITLSGVWTAPRFVQANSSTMITRPLTEWSEAELRNRVEELWRNYSVGWGLGGEPLNEVRRIERELWRRNTAPYRHPRVTGGEVFVIIMGDSIPVLPFNEQRPITVDGRLLVSASDLFERLTGHRDFHESELGWDQASQQISLFSSRRRWGEFEGVWGNEYTNQTIVFTVGSVDFTITTEVKIYDRERVQVYTYAVVNTYYMDIPVLYSNGHVMIPPRMMIETLGMSLTWCPERNALLIDRSGGEREVMHELREFEREIFRLTNIERANYGLQPLVWDNRLASAARAHSTDMSARGFFSHTCPSEVTFRMRAGEHGATNIMAENIASFGRTPPPNPASFIDIWMHSSAHRRAILNPEHRTMGVGVFNNGFQTHATQKFGR